MYGTLIRNAGWTFAECGEQPACDVFDFLEHLQEYPPDYVILAAVHLKPKPKKLTENEFAAQIPELQSVLGSGPVQPVPDELREHMAWAEKLQKKLKG